MSYLGNFVKRQVSITHMSVVGMALLLCLLLVVPMPVMAQAVTRQPDKTSTARKRHKRTPVVVPDDGNGKTASDSLSRHRLVRVVDVAGDTIHFSSIDSLHGVDGVEIIPPTQMPVAASLGNLKQFNPDPTRALWLSVLCPGLGQIYNRRYWKLPIVVGAFVGLGYGMAWNNRMLNDYTRAYRDATDNDPNTKSYMDFYPPTTKESDLDMAWLQRALKSKKDYYRRYRDICIFSMVGVYLLSVIDAYVDASLAHFDVSPDLSMRLKPAVIDPQFSRLPSVGLQCAINF